MADERTRDHLETRDSNFRSFVTLGQDHLKTRRRLSQVYQVTKWKASQAPNSSPYCAGGKAVCGFYHEDQSLKDSCLIAE